MCLVKTLLEKILWKKFQWRKKSATRIILPLIKTSLNFSLWCLQNLCTLWLVYSFQRIITHFLYMVCHLSQPESLSTCFMEDFYFCIATFVSLIARILLCLHMKTNSVFEIVLYADQINILHMHKQSILSWNPQNRINP